VSIERTVAARLEDEHDVDSSELEIGCFDKRDVLRVAGR
jgi:hypothetical protein